MCAKSPHSEEGNRRFYNNLYHSIIQVLFSFIINNYLNKSNRYNNLNLALTKLRLLLKKSEIL